MTSAILWNYYRDKAHDVDVNDSASDIKSYENKTKIVVKAPKIPPQPGNPGDGDQPAQLPVPSLNVEVTIPLKNLSNFRRSLNLPLVNCEIDVVFLWGKNCVLIGHHNTITEVNFITTNPKFYVPAVTLYITNSIILLKP